MATAEMCYYCFDCLRQKLGDEVPNRDISSFGEKEYPLFVSWKNYKNQHLRGCIGCFNAERLSKGLKRYALYSSEDSRFTPINLKELPNLSCEVNLLDSFETCATWDDWEIGVHGVEIFFKDSDNNQRSATFLPHVMVECEFDKKTTIKQLIRKAGSGQSFDSVLPNLRVIRYQSSTVSKTFEEYTNS